MPWDHEADAYIRDLDTAPVKSEDPILQFLRMAVKLAGEYRGRGVSYADLIGEANLALVEAARAYPTSRAKANGVPFGKYAARVIRNSLLDALRKAEPVHFNVTAWQALNRVRNEEGTDEEISADVGGLLAPETVRYLRGLVKALAVASFDEPWQELSGGGFTTLADITPDPSQNVEEDVLDSLERQELRRRLEEVMDGLPDLPKLAMSLRFGIRPPGLSEVSLDAVLQVCTKSHHWHNGIERMRRRMTQDDNTRAGAVVRGRGKYPTSRIFSKFGPGRPARIERDKNLWRRVASEPPPAAVDAG